MSDSDIFEGIDTTALASELAELAVISLAHANIESDAELSTEQKDFMHKVLIAGKEIDTERWLQLTQKLAQHPIMADPDALAFVQARFHVHHQARREYWLGKEQLSLFSERVSDAAASDKNPLDME
jgi:hypothetical protein